MVNLNKGQKVSLAKDGKALKRILVGLGWDTAVGCDMDLDASVFLVGNTGKVTCDQDFIFYNNLKDNYGAVQHMGDNRTGAGDGDDVFGNYARQMFFPHVLPALSDDFAE